MNNNDTFKLGKYEFTSRFILGSGKYSLELIDAAVKQAEAQIVTLALRRANDGGIANILDYIPENVKLLPNTSGARNAEEAVRIARLSRELCHSDMVKIEVIRDTKYLLPDNYETAKATEILAKEGFVVMPYMYPDLNAARDMQNAGAACIMPLAAPIGSNRGVLSHSGRGASQLAVVADDSRGAGASGHSGHGLRHYHFQHDHKIPGSHGVGGFRRVAVDVRHAGGLSPVHAGRGLDAHAAANQSRDRVRGADALRNSGAGNGELGLLFPVMGRDAGNCVAGHCGLQQGGTHLYGYGVRRADYERTGYCHPPDRREKAL